MCCIYVCDAIGRTQALNQIISAWPGSQPSVLDIAVSQVSAGAAARTLPLHSEIFCHGDPGYCLCLQKDALGTLHCRAESALYGRNEARHLGYCLSPHSAGAAGRTLPLHVNNFLPMFTLTTYCNRNRMHSDPLLPRRSSSRMGAGEPASWTRLLCSQC